MHVKILRDAHEDIKDGRVFYDSQELGVGACFSSTVYSDIRSLRNFGGIHPKRHGYHMMLVRRFPYAIFYDKNGSEITVVAVLSCRRDPFWITQRLFH